MKILLAVDGSEFTRRMLDYITVHPKLFGDAPDFTVLTVVSALPPRATAFSNSDTVHAYYDDEARQVLDPIRQILDGKGLKANYVHRVGNPGSEISVAAREGAFDMVVMGSHGHNAIQTLVMGSVAAKVVGGCEVPVLIVR
ncbi:universal stress protein [Variovorax dokdonensis]|uniref:Universal stress protein n=1 Tax=Variovorax dokdonensis TaxID=344883 RepID=A0ABT7N945_9BURK|nr:universal stress protein [Variovorax dokdonensis]